MKRTQASRGQTPDTGEAQDREGQMGSSLPQPDSLSAVGADYVAGRMGSPKGRVGSVSLFLTFFSVFLFLSVTKPRFLLFRSLSLCCLSIPLHPVLYSISLFSGLPHPTYLLWDLWRSQPCPTRDAKTGDTPSGQRTWAMNPVPPHPLPLQMALLPHTQLILNQ